MAAFLHRALLYSTDGRNIARTYNFQQKTDISILQNNQTKGSASAGLPVLREEVKRVACIVWR